MSGGGSGSSGAPANTTAVNTYIQDLPTWEQQYMTTLLGQSQAAASQPYQQFPGQQVAGFTPDQSTAFSNIENMVGGDQYGQVQNAGVGSALQGANTAQNITGAAAPFLGAAAAQGSAQGVQNYMSPFLGQEVQGLQTNASQNWNNSVLPSINDSFINSGGYGSGRNTQVIGQQASLADQALTGQIASAENTAYGTAGTLAQNQASNLSNIGNSLGNLANTQAGTEANIGTQLGALGTNMLNTGITANTALQDVGQQQQSLNQQNINTAMTNFQNQVQYPEQQLSWESNILHGLPSTTGTTGTTTAPTTNNVVGSVSPLSTLGGTLLGASGLGAAGAAGAPGAKKGGLIRGYADGGPVNVSDNVSFDGDPEKLAYISSLLGNSSDSSIPPVAQDVGPAPLANGSGPVISTPPPDMQPEANPPVNASPISSTNLGGNAYSAGTEQPKSPLGSLPPFKGLDPETARGYQLLAAAKGLLTPAHSGAEALGNAIGNYGTTGIEQERWMAEQQQKYLPLMQKQQEIAQEQEKIEQGKYNVGKNPITGEMNVFNTKTGQFMQNTGGPGSTNIPGQMMTPTGQPLTPDVSKTDQKVLDNMNKTFDPKSVQTSDQTTKSIMNILDRNNLSTMSGPISEANRYIPALNGPGAIPPDDYAQLKADTGTLKAQAMANSKNIRNQREFNAITSPANILGGGNISAKAQVQMLNAAAKEPYAENEFFNQYYDKYHTLAGSREVWQTYQKENDPIVRDDNQNPVGTNDQYFDPGNIKKYVDQAPDIYKRVTTAPAATPAGGQPTQAAPKQAATSQTYTMQDVQAAAKKYNKSPEQIIQDAEKQGIKIQQ